ncbi:hypothetical protein P5673_018741, partial [Acropora cervicornis]
MDNHAYEHKFNDFIEDLNIPQLSGEEKSFLEKDLTINELKEALTSFADNKSPGEDAVSLNLSCTIKELGVLLVNIARYWYMSKVHGYSNVSEISKPLGHGLVSSGSNSTGVGLPTGPVFAL